MSSSSSATSVSERMDPPFHASRGDILPEPLQALITPEKGAENRGVGDQNLSGPLAAGWKPNQRVELGVSRGDKRVRPGQVDGLPGEDMDGFRVFGRHLIMRQVR